MQQSTAGAILASLCGFIGAEGFIGCAIDMSSPTAGDMERYWQVGGRNPWRGMEVFPRAPGPFIRASKESTEPARELVIGQWGLIPWFAKTAKLAYSMNNARFEGIEAKASFKSSWQYGTLKRHSLS